MKPVLKYPGSKARIAGWIADHFPPHQIYVDPFFGSGSVYFEAAVRQRVTCSVINDKAADVVNFFSVMRDCPEELCRQISLTPWAHDEYLLATSKVDPAFDRIERARRFAVRCFQGFGARLSRAPGWRVHGKKSSSSISTWRDLPDRIRLLADLLLDCEVHNTEAVKVIEMYSSPNVLVYADPPYPIDARRSRDTMYLHEMTIKDHKRLLEALVAHPGPVVVSGYRHDLYDTTLAAWSRVERHNRDAMGKRTTEVLWINRDVDQRLF